MSSLSRKVAFVAFALAVFATTGCGGNAKKIVGKWKVTSVGGKSDDMTKGGIEFIIEFKSDGTGTMSIESSDQKVAELVKMMNEKMPTFKWTVKGDKIELTMSDKDKADGFFGKKEKGTWTIKFDGDNLTIIPDDEKDKDIKLTRKK
jgi:hypothetical protein